MERPQTPIPHGCSITLLSCRVDFGSSKPRNKFSRVRSDEKFSIYGNGSSRQKFSLKQHKSPMPTASQSLLYKEAQQQDISQISSVKGNTLSVNEINRSEKRGKVCKKYANNQGNTRRQSIHRNDNKQNIGSLLIDNGTNTNLFTDQITLNQYSTFDVKQRQTAHTNYFSRRAHTQQSNHRSSYIPFNQLSNRQVNTVVHRSQMLQPCYAQLQAQPQIVYNSAFLNNCRSLRHTVTIPNMNNPPIMYQQPLPFTTMPPPSATPSSAVTNSTVFPVPQRSPALKKSTYRQGKTTNEKSSLNCYNEQPLTARLSVQPQIQKLQLMNIKQHPIIPVSMMDSNEIMHMRKLSSPRFPKKFNTLVDLNAKNIDSSCGSRTSSNHVSILASQQTIKVSQKQSNKDQFTRMIKLMTLKSLPLNSQIWENRGQEFARQSLHR